jgi:N-acetyl-anhydromuramyl-L-alanine amidase AmpD
MIDIRWIGAHSKNFRAGRSANMRPEAVVIHIAVGSLKSVDNSFLSPTHGTSAHYCVGKDGAVHQYVREEDTAFHAGIVDRPSWKLLKKGLGVSPNTYTIGIEHAGMPDDPWTDDMYAASAELTAGICERWAIPIDADHIPMHREIRAGKSCPGFQFDRARYLGLVAGVPPATLTTIPAPSITPVTLLKNTRVRAGAPSTSGFRLARGVGRGQPELVSVARWQLSLGWRDGCT